MIDPSIGLDIPAGAGDGQYDPAIGLNPTRQGDRQAMRTTEQFSVTLPKAMAQMIRNKVASGEYASESEVVRDGLRALQARDRALETWLRTEIVAAYDEVKANPASLLGGDAVQERLAVRRKRATNKRP